MRLESMKPTTDLEREIRREAHALAILEGMTMRQAVYVALQLWIKEAQKNDTGKSHQRTITLGNTLPRL